MIPAQAELAAAGIARAGIDDGDAVQLRRQSGPALIEQRSAAGREPRLPDGVEGIGRVGDGYAGGGDGQKIAVDDAAQVILGREAIGGSENVGLAPANDLASDFGGHFAFVNGRAEFAQGERGTLDGAVVEVEAARRDPLAGGYRRAHRTSRSASARA